MFSRPVVRANSLFPLVVVVIEFRIRDVVEIKPKQCQLFANLNEKQRRHKSRRRLQGARLNEATQKASKLWTDAAIERALPSCSERGSKKHRTSTGRRTEAERENATVDGAVIQTQPRRIVDEAPSGSRADVRLEAGRWRGVHAHDDLVRIDLRTERTLQQSPAIADQCTRCDASIRHIVVENKHSALPICWQCSSIANLERLCAIIRHNQRVVEPERRLYNPPVVCCFDHSY